MFLQKVPENSGRIKGLQPIPGGSNDKDVAAMLVEITIEANEESFVHVNQHRVIDVTCERMADKIISCLGPALVFEIVVKPASFNFTNRCPLSADGFQTLIKQLFTTDQKILYHESTCLSNTGNIKQLYNNFWLCRVTFCGRFTYQLRLPSMTVKTMNC